MTATRPWKVPIGFVLSLCTALLLTASSAFATATADIEITKSSDVSSVAAGGTITYTITATNLGPNGASQVVIEDDVPTTLTNVQVLSVTQPSQCTVVGNVITCNMQGLGASGSINTIVFTADVVGSTEVGTTITNCAFEVSSNSTDPDHTNDSAPFSCGQGVSVVEEADMSVTKTQTSPDPGTVTTVPGATNITYHIVATNNGPSTATNVTVGDSFTLGSATFVSVDNVTGGLDCSGFTALPGSCTIASLASGSSVSFDLTVTAPNDGTTSITNTATTGSDTSDSDTSNNTSSVTTDICQSVNLAITKDCLELCSPPATGRTTFTSICGPDTPITEIQGGSDFQYKITVTNNDPSVDATNVVVSDTLPAGVTYVSDDQSCDTTALPVITCSTSLVSAAGGTYTVRIRITAVESGPVENSASVAADQCDRDTSDNSSSCSVTVDTNNQPTALEADRESSTTDTDCITTDPISTNSDVNRVFEPGESVRIDPTWHNSLDNADPDVTGSADTPASPAGGTLTIDDCTADYGAIPANSDSDCNTATGDCYQMTVTEDTPGVRPHLADHPRHWDVTFHETLSSGELKTWSLHVGDTFLDVPRSNGFYRFIETILHNHITVGCGDGTDFCPTAFTFRSQMAAFVARSLAGNDAAVPSSSGDYNCATGPSQFTDVPITNGFCKHINYLKDVKVANGCTLTEFCPQNDVTRGQMAIFIARAWEVQQGNTADPEGSIPLFGNDATGDRFYNCDSVDHANTGSAPTVDPIPANTAPFTDVASSGLVCKSAGLLFVQHIIDGFGDGSYHPAAFIRRDQAAKILTNAFVSLPLYGPLTF